MIPTLPELTRTFARIGLLSFGGPAAQIALMHREVVERGKWLSEAEYLSALSFCMLLPGPEAMQLATWIGWRSHGVIGGVIAGLLFLLPGAVVVLTLSMIYAAFGTIPLVAAVFTGVQAAVLAVVIQAMVRLSRRALQERAHWVIATLAFAALFLFGVPFPVVTVVSGLFGFLTAAGPVGPAPRPETHPATLRTLVVWGGIWLAPLAALWLLDGGILFEVGLFFSKLAVVTFGGAYAVLAWMVQAVVQEKGWLTLPQMMDGLGLAETTPGPLILVTAFVGYLAAYQHGGVGMGVAAAIITLWMTFAPCFLWIFVGAPYLARLTAQPRLAGALAAIMAAVVGVIANLSLWFAIHVLFGRVFVVTAGPVQMIMPDLASLRLTAAILALTAGYALLVRRWPMSLVLAATATAAALIARID